MGYFLLEVVHDDVSWNAECVEVIGVLADGLSEKYIDSMDD